MDKQQATDFFTRHWPPGAEILTTKQLLLAGIATALIRDGVKHGLLFRMRRGVFIPMHKWRNRTPWDKAKLAILGHILATENRYVYSHYSAARLHKLHVWDSSAIIHVTATYHGSVSRTAPDVVVHFARLDPGDVVEKLVPGTGLIKLTGLARTVVQCATTATFEQAVIIGDSALHQGLELRELEELLDHAASGRGIRQARRVVAALNKLSESAGETKTRLILLDLPIEQPELQVSLDTRRGKYRVDFLWRSVRLILEFDGETKYFDYPKLTEQALLDERERENALIEEGWRFIRLTWRHFDNPELLKSRILKAYYAAQQAAA
ncbi:type IV toxin-antitoxin system AbiEi family antitoxin domain-containing protein [Arthrobacter sp. Sr24]